MTKPSVSVVVCTVDRGHFLYFVMQAISQLRSSIQELIVVVGPTQDNTRAIVTNYKNVIDKVIYTKFRNVSIARNLGLKATSQEIIVYLDDDVISSEQWIQHHIKAHQQWGKHCGCVAGIVVDRTQISAPVQFARGVSSRLSESRPVLSPTTQQRYLAKSDWFAAAMGANASYKREALVEIGGFDEFFEYFLEETDICLRLLEAGYETRFLDVAVDHYVQPSHNRRDRVHLTCWYSLAKNTTYFALKHRTRSLFAPMFWLRLARLLIYRCGLRILRLKWTHGLPYGVLWEYLRLAGVGVRDGMRSGFALNHQLNCLPKYSCKFKL
ncbi:MAG: glycosyltransferase [Cyanobacteriota bacterium]|nr:glycosyltransferase [Cyanobacteriota bacterium]